MEALTAHGVHVRAVREQHADDFRVPVIRRDIQSGRWPNQCGALIVDVDAIADGLLHRFEIPIKSRAAKVLGSGRARGRRTDERRGQQ